MQDFEKYEDMIPAYLAGKLGESERADLESRLTESPELRSALDEFRQISLGLHALDAVVGDHVDSELLVAYGDDPDDLDASTRKEIERHLGSCDECREELSLCKAIPEPIPDKSNAVVSVLRWLVTPHLVLKPLHVAAVICLLVLPQVYMYTTREATMPSLAEFHLESVTRDVHSANIIEIMPDHTVVHLTFAVPTIDSLRYNLELYDADDQLIFTKPNNLPKNILAVEIPTTYLEEGLYQLKVIELDANQNPTETFEYEFRVVFPSP